MFPKFSKSPGMFYCETLSTALCLPQFPSIFSSVVTFQSVTSAHDMTTSAKPLGIVPLMQVYLILTCILSEAVRTFSAFVKFGLLAYNSSQVPTPALKKKMMRCTKYLCQIVHTGRYPIIPCLLSVCFDDTMHGIYASFM